MEGLGGRGRAHALEGGASCHDIYSVLPYASLHEENATDYWTAEQSMISRRKR